MRKLVVSTAGLPSHLSCDQKARRWVEAIAELTGASVDSPRPDGFDAHLAALPLDNVLISEARATSIRFKRESRKLHDASSESFLLLINDGRSLLGGRQRGEPQDISYGHGLGLVNTMPHVSYAMGGGSALSVTVSQAMLRPFLKGAVEDFAGRAIPGDSEPMRLLRSYLRVLMRTASPSEAQLSTSVSTHVTELVALALQGGVRHADRAPAVLSARAGAIIDWIRRNAANPGLNASTVGAALGISVRSVQLALKSVDTTFGDELRLQRLRNAHAALTNPRRVRSSILEIAEECGFADASTFYRAFKAEYACTPSDVRTRSKSGAE